MLIFTFVVMYGQFLVAIYMGGHYQLPDRAFMDVALLPVFPHIFIAMALADTKGWGLAKAVGKKRPGGLHPAVWIFLAVSIITCAWFAVVADNAKIGIICGELIFSMLWPVLLWFAYWKPRNRTIGYSAAYHMLNDGRSQEEMDRLVAEYKGQGLITS